MTKNETAAAAATNDNERLAAAFAAFDEANGRDPNLETVDGREEAKELLYGRRMTTWLDRLCPEASIALKLAARCQHLERWTIPRKRYPEGRVGYLTWRRDLKLFHAERARDILRPLAFSEEAIERVGQLLRKERLKTDPEVQALEDVVCIVFLVHYLTDFAGRHSRTKVVEILRKTWSKMSPEGQAAALALDLEEETAALVHQALSADGPAASATPKY